MCSSSELQSKYNAKLYFVATVRSLKLTHLGSEAGESIEPIEGALEKF